MSHPNIPASSNLELRARLIENLTNLIPQLDDKELEPFRAFIRATRNLSAVKDEQSEGQSSERLQRAYMRPDSPTKITLRMLRYNLGWSLKKVAELIEADPGTVRRAEEDSGKAHALIFHRLCEVYSIAPYHVYIGKEAQSLGGMHDE